MREFAGKARFVSENYGGSDLAKRFGVTRYPAIFVDDVLVATPKDFGFYGKGEGAGDGRYTPLKSAGAHERFRADLSRSIRLVLEGRKDAARAAAPTTAGGEVAAFPDVVLTDLEGRPISRRDLAGRAVLVEFWATWCPPCRGTLGWLGEVKKRYGDRLTVIAVAIESDDGVCTIAHASHFRVLMSIAAVNHGRINFQPFPSRTKQKRSSRLWSITTYCSGWIAFSSRKEITSCVFEKASSPSRPITRTTSGIRSYQARNVS